MMFRTPLLLLVLGLLGAAPAGGQGPDQTGAAVAAVRAVCPACGTNPAKAALVDNGPLARAAAALLHMHVGAQDAVVSCTGRRPPQARCTIVGGEIAVAVSQPVIAGDSAVVGVHLWIPSQRPQITPVENAELNVFLRQVSGQWQLIRTEKKWET